jgi:S-adenosylmethionine decarboxylase
LKTLGRHVLVELYNCDSATIRNVRRIEDIMVGAAKAAKCHIVDVVFHNFSPHGISGVVVIAESHLAIHTWPEYSFASIDIYTCGDEVNPWKAYNYLLKHFKAKGVTALELKRGMLNISHRRRAPQALAHS